MSIQLLVDGVEFRSALAHDIAAARDSVYVQTLSLEGDRAGQDLAELLLASAAPDKRVLVDCFSRWVVSDRFLLKHPFDGRLWRERATAGRMIAGLRRAGIGVRFTNPVGPLLLRFPGRNHKKIVTVDDRVAYVGGLNFSEHNFDWHDLTLRIEEPPVASFLGEDFLSTWEGFDQVASRRFPGLELRVLDGRSNPTQLRPVVDLIDGARQRIVVENPYVTPPFLERLHEASRRGVWVTLITPRVNNLPFVQRCLVWRTRESPIDVRFYEGRMTHMKAMLVDGCELVLGTANFDLWSYWLQQELVLIVSDPGVVEEFRLRVVGPDLAASTPCDAAVAPLTGRLADFEMSLLTRLARLLANSRAA